MNQVKIIRTDQDHEQALSRLMSLMDSDPAPGSAEENELEVLALLIESYEQKNFPIDPPDPIEAIKFRMEQQGLRQKDLIPFIGSAPKVTEVLNGSRKLSLNMIRKLSEGLGISADTLIRDSVQKSVESSNIDWHAFPLAQMRQRNYFDCFSGSLQELKEYAAEQLGRFISSVPSGFSLRPAMLRTSAHLRSNDKETDSYALWAWQVRVSQKAQEEQLPAGYKKGTVNSEWMRRLAQLSWSEQGPLLAKEFLNRSGIHLVFEPHFAKTYLDGAVFVSGSGSPVVALTLRHDRLDNFWFTLMHELAHIALHIDGEDWFIDDLDADSCDQKEKEADEMAGEALIPVGSLDELKVVDSQSVRALAKKLSISPDIIAGRLRHEARDHQLFGRQFRTKVTTLLD